MYFVKFKTLKVRGKGLKRLKNTQIPLTFVLFTVQLFLCRNTVSELLCFLVYICDHIYY